MRKSLSLLLLIGETHCDLNSDGFFSTKSFRHTFTLSLFPFGIPGRCTLTLAFERRREDGVDRRNTKSFWGISHSSCRFEFHYDSNIIRYKKNVSATSAYFRNRFQRHVCTKSHLLFLSFSDTPSSGITPGGQQRNTVKETAVETTAQGGPRCTIHPYSVSLSALHRLEILAALLSTVPSRYLRQQTRAKEGTKKKEDARRGDKRVRSKEAGRFFGVLVIRDTAYISLLPPG